MLLEGARHHDDPVDARNQLQDAPLLEGVKRSQEFLDLRAAPVVEPEIQPASVSLGAPVLRDYF